MKKEIGIGGRGGRDERESRTARELREREGGRERQRQRNGRQAKSLGPRRYLCIWGHAYVGSNEREWDSIDKLCLQSSNFELILIFLASVR